MLKATYRTMQGHDQKVWFRTPAAAQARLAELHRLEANNALLAPTDCGPTRMDNQSEAGAITLLLMDLATKGLAVAEAMRQGCPVITGPVQVSKRGRAMIAEREQDNTLHDTYGL